MVKIICFLAAWALFVGFQTAAQPSQSPTAPNGNLVEMADRATKSGCKYSLRISWLKNHIGSVVENEVDNYHSHVLISILLTPPMSS